MKAEGLRGKSKRKFKTTTNSNHQHPKAENLVQQNFDVATPNALWASDITYIATAEGWLYLAVTLDLFSRKVIGWAFSERLTDDLTRSALEMATRQRSTLAGLLHHSDQGAQYASNAFRAELNANGIDQACRVKAMPTTMLLSNHSSLRSKLKKSRAASTEPASKLKPASLVTLKGSTTPRGDTHR